ncbi:MAG: M48 family metallopeptidase [Acidobacteria bacterium]|nr:M48 family metallopeptidase [Acidobacteriota bacterium]
MIRPEREIFERVFRVLRPRTPVPEFRISFRPYADVNHVIRLRDGRVEAKLSDLLADAPPAVLEALATILIAKLYRKPIPKPHQDQYRRFLNHPAVQDRVHAMRQKRGRKWIGEARGEHYNLGEIFDDLNRSYFDNSLARPSLSWSRSVSRRALGHFDAAHQAIVISKIFDRAQVPRFLVEYILYHEMLHMKYPVVHQRDRRCFHTPLFRQQERHFPQYAEAKRLIEKL